MDKYLVEEFFGVVYEDNDGKGRYLQVSGLRRRDERLPINEETAFGIASGTKGFTALGILRLIDDGQLSLDDRVFDILPQDFPNMDKLITVRQLLTHTSGIYDYFDEQVLEDFTTMFEKVGVHKIHGPSDMYPLLIEGEMKGEPGEPFSYNNSGFVILGMLIEAVSGMSYGRYIHEAIVIPLDLVHTGCYDSRVLPANTALGYEEVEGRWLANTYDIPMIATGDGGLYTCGSDMAKLWTALVEGNFLSEELTVKVLTPQIVIDGGWCYGLGFFIQLDENGNPDFYRLIGEDPGVSFLSRYYVKEKRSVTILSNTSFGAWEMDKALKAKS